MERIKSVDEKKMFGQALGAVARSKDVLTIQESDLLIRNIVAAHVLCLATSAVDTGFKGILKDIKGV